MLASMGRMLGNDAPRERVSASELGRLESALREALAREPAVRWAYLFGSAARGEAFADLDVALVLDPKRSRGAVEFGSLVARVTHAVPSAPVDVVDIEAAVPSLRAAAIRDGRLLVDREPATRRLWEAQTLGRWLDMRPWLELQERLRLEAARGDAG